MIRLEYHRQPMSSQFVSGVLGPSPCFPLVSSVGGEDGDGWWVDRGVVAVFQGVGDEVRFVCVMDRGDPAWFAAECAWSASGLDTLPFGGLRPLLPHLNL